MMVQCVRCKTMIDNSKHSIVRIPGKRRKAVCISCHSDWERHKDRVWKQFLDGPKFEKRGLSAAQLAERGLLDSQKKTG